MGAVLQCLVPASLQAAATTEAPSNYTLEERDYLIRTIAFEADRESEEGKAAVAHVILTRKKSGRWGDSIKDVVTHPWQFEPWMTKRKEMERLSPDDPRYKSAARIADAVLTGQSLDPTAGATHFLNPTIVRKRRGGSLPSWALGEGQPIGRHTFYLPDEGEAAPQRSPLSLSVIANFTSMLAPGGSGEAVLLQVRRYAFGTARAESVCGQQPLTARSPGLPADDLVQLDAESGSNTPNHKLRY